MVLPFLINFILKFILKFDPCFLFFGSKLHPLPVKFFTLTGIVCWWRSRCGKLSYLWLISWQIRRCWNIKNILFFGTQRFYCFLQSSSGANAFYFIYGYIILKVKERGQGTRSKWLKVRENCFWMYSTTDKCSRKILHIANCLKRRRHAFSFSS